MLGKSNFIPCNKNPGAGCREYPGRDLPPVTVCLTIYFYQRPKNELKRPTSQIERIIEKYVGFVSMAMRINSNREVEYPAARHDGDFHAFEMDPSSRGSPRFLKNTLKRTAPDRTCSNVMVPLLGANTG